MDNVNSDSDQTDGSKSQTPETENHEGKTLKNDCIISRSSSPVFHMVTHMTNRNKRRESISEDDFTSYQLNQSPKTKRTSDLFDNEGNNYDLILPLEPVTSPPSLESVEKNGPTEFHASGNVTRGIDFDGFIESSTARCTTMKEGQKDVYESLKMNDKDVSWVSDMATPAPCNVISNDFNTIERATFFPEEGFRNVQARALFLSNSINDDVGCEPIQYSSDDEDSQSYEATTSLPGFCEKFQGLNVLSAGVLSNDSTANKMEEISLLTPEQKSQVTAVAKILEKTQSPIIIKKKKKGARTNKRKKGGLMCSPTNIKSDINSRAEDNLMISATTDVCHSASDSICSKLTGSSLEKTLEKLNDVHTNSHVIQDDSFQNYSFSGIEELFKVSEVVDNSVENLDIKVDTEPKSKVPTEKSEYRKICYKLNSDQSQAVLPLNCLNGLLKSVTHLEEADTGTSHKKLQLLGTKEQMTSFNNLLNKLNASSHEPKNAVKRLISKVDKEDKSIENDNSSARLDSIEMEDVSSVHRENKRRRFSSPEDVEVSNAPVVTEELSCCDSIRFMSEPDITESQMCQTLEDVEKMMQSRIGWEISEISGIDHIQVKDDHNKEVTKNKVINEEQEIENEDDVNTKAKTFDKSISAFQNSSGEVKNSSSDIQSSNKTTKEVEHFGDLRIRRSADIPGTLETINEVQEELSGIQSKNDYMERNQTVCESDNMNDFKGFKTASGLKIIISRKALHRARKQYDAIEIKKEETEADGVIGEENALSETIKISSFTGFMTCTGKEEKVSEKALKEVKANEELEMKESNFIHVPEQLESNVLSKLKQDCIQHTGFKTALGKSVQASESALKKARASMNDLDDINQKHQTTNSSHRKGGTSAFMTGFTTASGNKVNVSTKTLQNRKDWLNAIDNEKTNGKDSCSNDDKTGLENENELHESTELTAKNCLNDFNHGILHKNHSDDHVPSRLNTFDKSRRTTGFTTASGNKVNVSAKTLQNRKDWLNATDNEKTDAKVYSDSDSESLKNDNKLHESNKLILNDSNLSLLSKNGLDNTSQRLTAFTTASGNKVNVSAKTLQNRKDWLNAVDSDKTDAKDCSSKDVKASLENENKFIDSTKSKPKNHSNDSNHTTLNKNDSEEYIPLWLNIFNTSPSFMHDRNVKDDESSPVPKKTFIAKSPVLASTDRFFGMKKHPFKKLEFDNILENGNKTFNGQATNLVDFKERKSKKRDSSNLSIDYLVPFKKHKLNEEETAEDFKENEVISEDVIKGRAKARNEQEKAITSKGKVKPIVGSHLMKKKKELQTKLKDFVDGCYPKEFPAEELAEFGVKSAVINVNIENALDFKFEASDFYESSISSNNIEGISAGDGCSLIFDDNNQAGINEFTRAFLASPGVEPGLVSKQWVANHYKWIIWKLAHYETAFPKQFGGKLLTPHNVLLQLKYRYDREIDRNERSALKKILERDDASTKRLILCIFNIKKMGALTRSKESVDWSRYELEVTDGWYSCPCRTDAAMTRYIESGKIAVGTKLITHGAELVNCDQGVSPLEMPDSIYLKIWTNSTRRVRWDAKLGFQNNPGCIPIPLTSILPQGGVVGRVDVVIARIYPIVYAEKNADGSRVIRNSRMENRAAALYQQQREAKIEKIYSQLQSEVQKHSKSGRNSDKNISAKNVSEITNGDDLFQLLQECSDPAAFQNLLSVEQRDLIENFQQRRSDLQSRKISERLEEKLKEEKINPRDVTEVLRVRIIDFRKPDHSNPGLLSIWRPTEEITSLFSEGKAVSLLNVTASNYSRSGKNVQLNTTRQTQYREISKKILHPARVLSPLCNLTADFQPFSNEIDVVGIVVHIQEVQLSSKLSQTVYLTDSGKDLVGIVFDGRCKDFGWERVLTVRSIVAGSNLQWRKNSSAKSIPSVYVNENTVFTENPKQKHLERGINDIKKLNQNLEEVILKCREEITSKLGDQSHQLSTSKSMLNCSDSSTNDSGYVKPRYLNAFASKPNASSTPIKSSRTSSNSNEREPSHVERRIEKLSCYGEPPPISPLIPKTIDKKFKTRFRVPLKAPTTNKETYSAETK